MTENEKVKGFASYIFKAGITTAATAIIVIEQLYSNGFWIFLIGTAMVYCSGYLLIPAPRHLFINGSFFKFLKKIAG